MMQAGIVGKITQHTPDGRKNSSLSFHSLRHSFNSAMANAGVSVEIRQKLIGHSSAQMNAQYTHHELEPLRAAVALIPSIGR
jgi:site-specific recombinase XerD